jgi:multidrug efflux system membrane fusion protein
LGNVEPYQQTVVRPQIDGKLIEISFREGAEVKAGDILAKIDPRPFQATVNQATAKKSQDEALLANARADEKRYQELVDRNFISRQQLDTTRSLVAQLEAAVKGDAATIDSARVMLDYTVIRAPINGRAGIRLIDVGNIVHPSDANGIVNLTQLHPIAVLFTLPEDQVPQVLMAQKAGILSVKVLSRDNSQVLGQGRLELVDNQIDQTTAMIKLKAIFDNKDGMLWPGQFVNALLEVGLAKDAVVVPVGAIQRGQQGSFIWAVKSDGTAEPRPATIGQINNGLAIVQSGIAADEKVVISGHYRLQPGVRVTDTSTGGDAQK